ncbi:DUF6308 family protein [Millisia brevis]|uniref:DUF6308 family protein n=1 Tax=Millisia brevis TaxID=264148 RepID=UPI0009FC5723|nr:DUF6308 family protein [Millisia brevis]
MTQPEYNEWRQRWPSVVTETKTARAAELVRRYYSLRANNTPRYSGSRFESIAALNTDPNRIGPADLVAVSTLSVSVPGQAAIRILGPDAQHITLLLEQIPTDRTIIDVDPDSLAPDSTASQLWNLLRRGRDGVGPTITSKLLAAKRPHLIPIWDSFVNEATGVDTPDSWRRFREVLVADDHTIWNWLGDVREEASIVPDIVSTLRLLDVILWMSVDQQRTRSSDSRPQVSAPVSGR